MAKCSNDPGTIDAFPIRRGPGRPPTGMAMSVAERVRRFRERRRAAGLPVTSVPDTSVWKAEREALLARIAKLERQVAKLRRR